MPAWDLSTFVNGQLADADEVAAAYESGRESWGGLNLVRDPMAHVFSSASAADYWTLQGVSGAAVARETSTKYKGAATFKITGGTSASAYLSQTILSATSWLSALASEYVGFACGVRGGGSNSARIGIYDGVGTTWSSDTGMGGWAPNGSFGWIWVVRQLDASATELAIRLDTAQGVVSYFGLPTMLWGSAPPARYRHPARIYRALGPGTQRGASAVLTTLSGWKGRPLLPMLITNTTLDAVAGPSGTAAIYDVNNATNSCYSTRPQISAGQTQGSAAPDAATYAYRCVAQNAVVTVDCDQAGSTPAQDVTPIVWGLCYPHPFADWAPATCLTEIG